MKHVPPTEAPKLVRAARTAAGISQAELARWAGVQQSHVAAIESGSRAVSAEMLHRVLRAAEYRPGIPLSAHAQEIVRAGARDGIHNIRSFGSVARGTDTFDSDIDLLVELEDERSYFDVANFVNEVEDLTGFRVDVVIDGENRPRFLTDADLVPL